MRWQFYAGLVVTLLFGYITVSQWHEPQMTGAHYWWIIWTLLAAIGTALEITKKTRKIPPTS